MNQPLSPVIIEETSTVGSSTPREHSSSPALRPDAWNCSDFLHCAAVGDASGELKCEEQTRLNCQGLTIFGNHITTPNSYVNAGVHSGPDRTETCAHCRAHEGHPLFPNKRNLVNSNATTNPLSGYRTQLCTSCIHDEVEFYWLRQGQPMPGNIVSLNWARQWPAVNGLQDLCICEGNSINDLANTHCHACRDEGFNIFSYQQYAQCEDVRRNCIKPIIQGKRPYDPNAVGPRHRVSATTVNRRMADGIGRMCPCGKKPKRQSTPEYITICLSCSGVRIDPVHLPPDLQQAPMMDALNRRTSLRGWVMPRTKGPARANRHPSYRVNIERGWLTPDLRIGGT
jgi:hypothetical protein